MKSTHFKRVHFFALLFVLFNQLAVQTARAQSENTNDEHARLENLILRVNLSEAFAKLLDSTAVSADEVCDSLGEQLQVGRGPWSFGLFSGVASCHRGDATSAATTLEHPIWELRVDLNSEKHAYITLVRTLGKKNEKIEAQVTIPTSKYLPQLLVHPKLSRFIAAILIDQAPLRSKLSPEILENSTIRARPEVDIYPYQLPTYRPSLIPIEVSYQKSGLTLQVKMHSTSVAENLSKSNHFWVTTRGRGEMGEEIFTQFLKAIEAVGSELLEKETKSRNAAMIVGRNARREAKAIRLFRDRIETHVETRGRISVSNKNDYTFGLVGNVLFTESNLVNIWIKLGYLHGKVMYKMPTNTGILQDKVSGAGTRSYFEGAIGSGLRMSSETDHTWFVYPRVEIGILKWDGEYSFTGVSTEKSKFNFTSRKIPGLGIVAGYQSPEVWPIQWQAKLELSGIRHTDLSSYTADVAGYFPSPVSVSREKGEIFAFSLFEQRSIKMNEGKSLLRNFKLRTSDVALGVGYRALFL